MGKVIFADDSLTKRAVFIDDVVIFDGLPEDSHISRQVINEIYCFMFSKGVFRKAIGTYHNKKTPNRMWFTINLKHLQKWENETREHFAVKPEYEEWINFLFLNQPRTCCVHCGAISYVSYMKTFRDYCGCVGSELNCCHCYGLSNETVSRIAEIRHKFGETFAQVYKHLYDTKLYYCFDKFRKVLFKEEK